MKNNRGFTLVELLATIVILSLVLSITAIVAINVINNARKKSYEVTINNIEKNAGNYITENDLFYVTGENNTEYQCIKVKDLIDKGFLKNDIIDKSKVSEGKTVQLNDYIYIERNAITKAITKTQYASQTTLCDNSTIALGDIIFSSNPGFDEWSKEKDITITYKLKTTTNINANYNYNYSGKSTELSNENNKKKVKVTSNGLLVASIGINGDFATSTIAYKEKEITKIDNVGPVITSDYNGINPVKDSVVIPLKVTDEGIGLNEESFTKDDITVSIGNNNVSNSNLTLTNQGNGIYNLTIKNDNNAFIGKTIIKIGKDKVLDKLGNGNSETTLETVTFANGYNIIYNCNGGHDGPANQEVYQGSNYTISSTGCTREGYTFTGWYDSSNVNRAGETGKWNSNSSLELKAGWSINTVTIKYNLNGGVLAKPYSSDLKVQDNILLYKNNEILHTLKYGEKLGNGGLWNWNNPGYLNVTKEEYSAIEGKEWNTKADGSGTSFNHNTIYGASDFCPNIEKESCEVILYLNWDNISRPLRIYYSVNGGKLGNQKFNLKGSWIAQKDTSVCVSEDASVDKAANVMFKDSDNYCYQAGFSSQNIDFWNYNSSNWLNITRDGYGTESKNEYYITYNGTKKSFDQSSNYTYAKLRSYSSKKDSYYSLNLYVNWVSDNVGSGSSGGKSGGGCFLAGTKVVTLNGYKEIDKVKIGDMVLTYNEGTGVNEYHRVVHLLAYNPNEINERLYTLTFDDQTNLQVSSTHRFYIKRDDQALWIATKDIRIGDIVMYSNKKKHRIVNINQEELTKTVYNLSIDNTHNFYVGDQEVLVHNVNTNDAALK